MMGALRAFATNYTKFRSWGRIVIGLLIWLAAGCVPFTGPPPLPIRATFTAGPRVLPAYPIVTALPVQVTAYPVVTQQAATETLPVAGSITPRPTPWPFPLTVADNGGTFTYCVTCRFVLFLDPALYPPEDLVCFPPGIASYVSNASGIYDQATGFTSAGFEGVNAGTCAIRSGDFEVFITIVE
jgi:hypothetical protein